MRRFEKFRGRYRLEAAVVVVPLLAILVLQYVSSRRLAEVEVVAHQTTISGYLDTVIGGVRRVYETAAREVLAAPADALAAKRFEELDRHFRSTDASVARLLFAVRLDQCWCQAHYFDPLAGTSPGEPEAGVETVVLRVSTLLQASTLPRHRLRMDPNGTYVDELDPDTRVVYRFVVDQGGEVVGVAGFVVDVERFEREYLPRALAGALASLPDDVRDNLVVRVTDGEERVVTATHDEPGQADVLAGRFDFVFRDWEVSARSRHTAAARILQSNAATTWWLTALMSFAVLSGVMLTWRASSREQRLSRMRSAFLANASHELRTPLASLAVFGEFLRRGRVTSPRKVAEYGRHIEHESNRLQQLIDNVLDFARIESSTVEYCRREVAVEDFVGVAIRTVDARRERDGFTISVDCAESAAPVVRVDGQAMTQVFVNLLDNAMKYSGRSRRIRVGLSVRGGCAAVGVEDFGIGIAPDDRERIFQQFYRTAAAVEEQVGGTGLGLAIARHVVQAHGGTIEVDGRPGFGTTFTVLIPLFVPAAEGRGTDVPAAVGGVGLKVGAEA